MLVHSSPSCITSHGVLLPLRRQLMKHSSFQCCLTMIHGLYITPEVHQIARSTIRSACIGPVDHKCIVSSIRYQTRTGANHQPSIGCLITCHPDYKSYEPLPHAVVWGRGLTELIPMSYRFSPTILIFTKQVMFGGSHHMNSHPI